MPPDSPQPRHPLLSGKRIALCVTGSIAAYKAAVLARLLVKEGAQVSVVMSDSARELIGPATFSGITGDKVYTNMFETGGELHVELAKSCQAAIVFPATADSLARFAQGRANDLIAALLLCMTAPVLVAPAMHPAMWHHPATQRNVATLRSDGRVILVGPVAGEVASGDHGMGRMVEPETMLHAVRAALSKKDLQGRRLLITSGPTVEDIDPVRFITNRSTGKMGFALAERAAWRGAQVTLISGPSSLPTPEGVTRVDVRSASELQAQMAAALGPDLGGMDALLMAAAVADHRPQATHATKLKRQEEGLRLDLVANPDLLAEIGKKRQENRQKNRPVLVGFAVETGPDDEIEALAKEKLIRKGLDLIVANPGAEALGRDDNRAQLISGSRSERLPRLHKADLADRILDELVRLLAPT
jgi:phosphopantothenoylcysteine decarboxylase/phosphopantothenate--cysteine ligase